MGRVAVSVALVLAAALVIAAAACSPKPPDERGLRREDRGRARGERRRVRARRRPDSAGQATRSSCRSPTSRSIRTTTSRPICTRSTTRRSIEMPTSTGANRKMRRVGTLEFTLKGQPLTLTAFNEVGTDPDRLFVPFSDLTNGTETYAAGRFMDLTGTPPASTKSTSTAPTSPTATTTRPTSAPTRRRENRLKMSDSRRRADEEVGLGIRDWKSVLRAIVFDFDGVIANSEPLHFRAFRDVLADEGVTLTEADYYARYLGFDDVGVFQAFGAGPRPHGRVVDIAALVGAKGGPLEALERDVSVLFPGAAAAIRRAAAAMPIAIASGALGAEIRRVLEHESWPPASPRSSPPKTRRPASLRRIRIFVRWPC